VILAGNKSEGRPDPGFEAESLSLGFGEPIALSAEHGLGLAELREALAPFSDDDLDTDHGDVAAEETPAEDETLADDKPRPLRLAIVGRPNVGKSSLLNRLAGEERAIVTPVAGTTRDALRESILIDGVPLVVIDTAGLRPSTDPVERLGIERTQRELGQADLVMAVFEAGETHAPLQELPAGVARLEVYNKIDLVPGFVAPQGAVAVSALTGAGLEALRAALLVAAGWSAAGESVFLARERHLRALQLAASHLESAAAESRRWEIFAEELRLAQEALAAITGEFTADDLLGEIFNRFCIGK
jgi:tRNA modification GTPase